MKPELAIVYQAYLEVKERIYYTSSLVDLWNQIEEVQNGCPCCIPMILLRRICLAMC